MADSDEEFERRRARDKFRGERNEYERRDDRRGGGGGQWEDRGQGRREHWEQMAGGGGGGGGRRERTYSDHHRGGYDRGRRERYPSPGRHEMSPPQMKRMRRDWSEVDYPTQPPMMAFKHFLSQQEDSITDEEAIKRFNEYKLDFKKAQISEFFLAHKDEEWFKAKYHPEECGKRKEELKTALENRAKVFGRLMAMGLVDCSPLDLDKCDDLIKLLDAAVIMMEGGSEFDLRLLEVPTHHVNITNSKSNENEVLKENENGPEPIEEEVKKDKEEEEKKDADEETEEDGEVEDGEEGEEKPKQEDSDTEKQEPEEKAEPSEKEKKVEEEKDENTKGKKRKRDKSESGSDSASGSDSDSATDDEDSPKKGRPKDQSMEEGEETGEPGELGQGDDEAAKGERSKEEKERDAARFDNDEPRPRALHRTCSIFLRNLAPTITRQEVEAMCKRYPGFMRVALQDPQPERRFLRRGWVTFERTVNIKDICWNLNNIRLRDCEMGAIVNRELKQRVRPVNGVTNYQQVIKADVKLAAKIVQNLDMKWELWEEKKGEKTDSTKDSVSIGLQSRNPVLKNITDFLVEEGDYEEEELLGVSTKETENDTNAEVSVERDEELIKFIKVLDRMILYLRIVHSFDFYSAVEYPNEDEMPHRCGIIHARGPLPPVKMTQSEVNDYLNSFEQKVNGFINLKLILEKEEAVKMGLKDGDAEVEKFVSANTQELGKDKWLCPLSGKKFKGPAFVRKHIFNKHMEKIEEVKKEVAFFNNFLLDPKRPSLPEHPGNRPGSSSSVPPPTSRSESGYSSQNSGYSNNQSGYQGSGGGGGGYHRGGGGSMGGGYQGRGGLRRNGGGYQGNQGGRGGYDRGYDRGDQRRDRNYQAPRQMRDGRRQDPRSIIEYRDLDAPDDIDIF